MSGLFFNVILFCSCLLLLTLCILLFIKYRRVSVINKIYSDRISEMDKIIELRVKDRTKKLEEIRDSVSGYAVQKFELAQELSLRNREIMEQKDYNAKQSEKLRVAYDEIRKLDSFRQQMVRMMIHDLKNPLNVILNLTDNDSIPSKPRSIIRQISFEMLDLILNILDVNKFEEMKMKIDYENINVFSLVSSLIEKHSPLFANSSLGLVTDIPNDLWIYSDRHIINRIFGNLLSNAIKYTPSGGVIQINAKADESVTFEIKDNGTGIPKNNVENLFNMYSQGEKAKSLYNSSTGIGLAYCKLAVEALAGEIGIITEPGEGTTVWFTIRKGMSNDGVTIEDQSSNITLSLKDYSLTEDEITVLKPVLTDLKLLSICEITKILELTSKVDSEYNEHLASWKEMVEETVFSANEVRFRELIRF